jgi:hypothetical protein
MVFVLVFFLIVCLNLVAVLLDIWIAFRLKTRHADEWLVLAGRFLRPRRLIRWVHGPGHMAIGDGMLSRVVLAARSVHWTIVIAFVAMVLGLVSWP